MESVFVVYMCDTWHSYSSMTPDNIVGIASNEQEVRNLLIDKLKIGFKKEIAELIENKYFKSINDFVVWTLNDFMNNKGQTQNLSRYIDHEFYAEEVRLNTLLRFR